MQRNAAVTLPGSARLRDLSRDVEFDPVTGTLQCLDAGDPLVSGYDALVALCNLQRAGHPPARLIRFVRHADATDAGASAETIVDRYPLYFQANQSAGPVANLRRIGPHVVYRFLDFGRLRPLIACCFTPSVPAQRRLDELQQSYRIDPASTLAVVVRAADPGSPLRAAPPESFLRLTRQLLHRYPGYRIWIDSDDAAVRRMFCREFGERCFFVDGAAAMDVHGETPSSQGDRGLQRIATVSLQARCDVIVCHTGCTALWVCLLRGGARQVWQFDDEGGVVNPAAPGCYFGALRRLAVKGLRRVRRAAGLGHDTWHVRG
jgi:hypothetical protein